MSSALFAGEKVLFMIPRVDSLVVAWKRARISKHERRRLRLEHLAGLSPATVKFVHTLSIEFNQ